MSQEGDVQGGIVSTLNIRRSATAADDDHDDDDDCGDVTDMVTDRCFMLPLCLLRRGSDSPPLHAYVVVMPLISLPASTPVPV